MATSYTDTHGTHIHTPAVTAAHVTTADAALLVARLGAGIVFLPHGAQHLFGAFGGPGLQGTVQAMGPVGYLVAVGEFFGAIGLLLGVLSRFSAASLIVIMLGAIKMVHLQNGFFMNWVGRQAGEGFEYHLLMIALLVVTLLAGPGALSVSGQAHLPKATE